MPRVLGYVTERRVKKGLPDGKPTPAPVSFVYGERKSGEESDETILLQVYERKWRDLVT